MRDYKRKTKFGSCGEFVVPVEHLGSNFQWSVRVLIREECPVELSVTREMF